MAHRLTSASNSILSAKPLTKALLFFLLWTFVALFWATRAYLIYHETSTPLPWWESYCLSSVEWYMWGIASLLVYRFCKWYGTKKRSVSLLLGLHLLFALSLSALLLIPYNAAYRPLEVWFMHEPLPPALANFWDSYRTWFLSRYHMFVIDYALIAVGCYALLMYERYRTEELRASQLQSTISEMQLQALKAQLHPHFLFNTLHTISTLVRQDPDGAEKMISRLGDLLRLTLQSNQSQVTSLGREIEFTQLYLEIQGIRFSDRLTTKLDIAPETLSARIPSLLLQPLVENAIVHGISPRAERGTVRVTATKENDRLHLTVADDGVGMGTGSTTQNSGIGLANIRQRLNYLYGENHSFALAAAPGKGVTIDITIPFEIAASEQYS